MKENTMRLIYNIKNNIILLFGSRGVPCLLSIILITSTFTLFLNAGTDKIPIEDFFRNPIVSNVRISPDGTYIAYLAPYKHRMNIYVKNIQTEMVTRLTSFTDRDLFGFKWFSSDRILYLKDLGGHYEFKLYGVTVDGKETKCYTDYEGADVRTVASLPDKPDEIIIAANKRIRNIKDTYRLNLKTGEMTLLMENDGSIGGYLYDHSGIIRILIKSEGLKSWILYRQNTEQPFRKIIEYNTIEDYFSPEVFSADNSRFYAYSNLGRDRIEVVEFDPESGKETTVLASDPVYDLFGDDEVDHVHYSDKLKGLDRVFYTTWKRKTVSLHEESRKLIEKLDRKFADYNYEIISSDKNETKHIIHIEADRLKGEYYLYNSKKDTFRKIFESAPWLKTSDLSETKPLKYKARDGIMIYGYLTVPKGKKAENLPLVVYPHPGPEWRNSWTYDSRVQFLANRGYAVFQTNFRISEGYGKKFHTSGFKQIGLKIQDDITDGVKYLINQGIVDKNRIAILGFSFGGYAALAGLTFTPELYKCAVDMWGVSDYTKFIQSLPSRINWDDTYAIWGDPVADNEYMKHVSPINHLEKIKAPLLIAQGANDPIIKKEQSDIIYNSLKKRGYDVKYILKEDEGHSFSKEENMIELWNEIEKFLAKHMK
jgi:dipeptidyl aminopeptidase/acylaminoacyl peptidase